MKKIIALSIALSLVLSLAIPALAYKVETDPRDPLIWRVHEGVNPLNGEPTRWVEFPGWGYYWLRSKDWGGIEAFKTSPSFHTDWLEEPSYFTPPFPSRKLVAINLWEGWDIWYSAPDGVPLLTLKKGEESLKIWGILKGRHGAPYIFLFHGGEMWRLSSSEEEWIWEID